ncbi:MAG: ATP-binding protein [Planctomycetaceae bacterium]
MSDATPPPKDDAFVDRLLSRRESAIFECKRIGKVDRLLESVIAFANSEGGVIALGFEDPDKASGRDRVYGIQCHPMNWDELRRKLHSRITEPDQLLWTHQEVRCTLRDGSEGSIILLKIQKSSRVHSIVDDGTFVRLSKGNRELTATEINDLCHARGIVSAETWLEEVDFELLETDYWLAYSRKRRLTRRIDEAMLHLGLAKRDEQRDLRPNRAAVLLFAEEPSGLLASKAAVRIFHYRGPKAATDPNTNLLRPPVSIGGPLVRQISEARQRVINELAGGVQFGPLGFEIVQKYPVRVIAEAITNAVIHRDYRLSGDVIVRIFSDRIEVDSPGLLVGPVTAANIGRVGPHSRNPLIIQHLREFPDPPNLDAGEGVRMMFGTMREAGLYPPQYLTRPRIERDAVVVFLRNQHRPSIWEQVTDYIERNGTIGNAEVRRLIGTDDTLGVSKQLKNWVEQGLLVVANPDAGRNVRRYMLPGTEFLDFFSNLDGKEESEMS